MLVAVGGILMAERNQYVNQPCRGRDVVQLMRDINAIEAVCKTPIAPLDVMIIIDISYSMQPVIDTVCAQVERLFSSLVNEYSQIRLGLMQQGVDGSTTDSSWARRALIRSQPTRDQSVFQAAINAFPGGGWRAGMGD